MKTAVYSLLTLLFFSQLGGQEGSRDVTDQSSRDVTSMFSAHRLWSKGGIGIINTRLYVAVRSVSDGKNEIIVKPTPETEERWRGKSITKPEVAFFYEGKVWSTENLPEKFDLSRAVVVSFEKDKVRFFDFQVMSGGYYDRIPE